MILLTSGAPTNLASGQTFTVDFFIADPAGQLLDVSGPVAISVMPMLWLPAKNWMLCATAVSWLLKTTVTSAMPY